MFSARLDGLPALRAELARMRSVLSDLTPDFDAGAKVFAEIEAARFAGENDWAADSEGTTAYKEQEGFGTQPMVRTGGLLADLTAPLAFERSPLAAAFGTDRPYARYQQEGFTQRWAFGRFGDRLVLERRRNSYFQEPRTLIDVSGAPGQAIADAIVASTEKRLDE